MTGAGSFSVSAMKARGVSISNVQKSGSGFSPARFTKGKQGRSKTSSSCDIALKGAMSTPTALMLQESIGGGLLVLVLEIWQADVGGRAAIFRNGPKESALPFRPEKC